MMMKAEVNFLIQQYMIGQLGIFNVFCFIFSWVFVFVFCYRFQDITEVEINVMNSEGR
jgi:hypothetical protein